MTIKQEQTIERIGKELKLTFPKLYGRIQFDMKPEILEVRGNVLEGFNFKEPKSGSIR